MKKITITQKNILKNIKNTKNMKNIKTQKYWKYRSGGEGGWGKPLVTEPEHTQNPYNPDRNPLLLLLILFPVSMAILAKS